MAGPIFVNRRSFLYKISILTIAMPSTFAWLLSCSGGGVGSDGDCSNGAEVRRLGTGHVHSEIFLGAAVSQASTLGTAVAIWIQGGAISHVLGSEVVTFLLAVLASVATALLTSRASRPGHESAEAVTGWVFLVGSTIPVLLLASNPHGLEEVHRLLFSSILGASRADVFLFCGLLVATVVGIARLRDRIVLFAMDPEIEDTRLVYEKTDDGGLEVRLIKTEDGKENVSTFRYSRRR